jgi:ssDNA-binding Zn-finger/Zn-ribbon topoisomerase 1
VPDVRPSCPRCGKAMYVYHRSQKIIRFRCSDYPECHTYVPVLKKEI